MMILKIAWRNIWRNRTRSLVLILSIVLGMWAGAFIMAFYWGMSKQQVDDTISRTSHIFSSTIPTSEKILKRNIPLPMAIRWWLICNRTRSESIQRAGGLHGDGSQCE